MFDGDQLNGRLVIDEWDWIAAEPLLLRNNLLSFGDVAKFSGALTIPTVALQTYNMYLHGEDWMDA